MVSKLCTEDNLVIFCRLSLRLPLMSLLKDDTESMFVITAWRGDEDEGRVREGKGEGGEG